MGEMKELKELMVYMIELKRRVDFIYGPNEVGNRNGIELENLIIKQRQTYEGRHTLLREDFLFYNGICWVYLDIYPAASSSWSL